MRALITGGAGQLASDLQLLLGPDSRSFSHAELDVTNRAAVDRAFESVEPDIVFNCAAFHNLDECERDPDSAWAVNVSAVRDLASRGVPVVHLSTNYVFDGSREQAYAEEEAPSPRSMYALTKLAGEYVTLAYGTAPLVIRTAGLFGLNGSASKGGNFVQRMVARAQTQDALTVVSDQRLQPTFTADLAGAIVEAVDKGVTGLLHLTASDACSWYDFTCAIMAIAGLDVTVLPTATVSPAGAVERPLNGVLARPRADALGLSPLRGWRDALGDYMVQAGLAAGSVRDGGGHGAS